MKKSRGSGDRGETGLLGQGRVGKDDARIEACGEIDELNCVLGVLISHLPGDRAGLLKEIQDIQSDLMHLGTLIAATSASKIVDSARVIIEERTELLTEAADRMDEDLPGLKRFILPGGHASAAWAHMARAVCRRAERRVVRLLGEGGGRENQGPQKALVYLNRLSDYLFVMARHWNRLAGQQDTQWRR